VTVPQAADGNDRVLTLPNVITAIRLCCIPVFCWMLFGTDRVVASAWLLAVLGATDWVDGFLARRLNQVSELGKYIDPIADRLLFIVCVTAIIWYGAVPRWFGVAVVFREFALGAVLAGLKAFGMKRFDVAWIGKLATFALMVAFPLFMIAHANTGGWSAICRVLAWAVGLPGLIVSWYAAFAYVPVIRRAWREGRADRAGNRRPTTTR
jgi:cardiolipin synthase (CMP-forming)